MACDHHKFEMQSAKCKIAKKYKMQNLKKMQNWNTKKWKKFIVSFAEKNFISFFAFEIEMQIFTVSEKKGKRVN